MSDPLSVQRTLDHCMLNIEDASKAMPHDMHDAAMRLGTAAMMLASASDAVHKRAAGLVPAQTRRDTGEEPSAGR
jgi:hypothetical protein